MDRRNSFKKKRREKKATKMFHGMRACFRVHVCECGVSRYAFVYHGKKRKDSIFRIYDQKKV